MNKEIIERSRDCAAIKNLRFIVEAGADYIEALEATAIMLSKQNEALAKENFKLSRTQYPQPVVVDGVEYSFNPKLSTREVKP